MGTEAPLTDEKITAISERLREQGGGGLHPPRHHRSAAATGSLGVLGALGIDTAEAGHGTGQVGESGNPLSAVYSNKIGDASEPVHSANFESVDANTETFADTAQDPTSNGEFRRNGTDMKVYLGGSVKNLSNIGSGGGVTIDTHIINETGSVASGDAGLAFSTQLSDTETFEVYQSGLVLADGTAAPTDLDLVIITLDNAGGSTKQTTIILGDGTLKNDETGDPLASYTNTTGGAQTVAVAVDNGQYNTGAGNSQDVVTEGYAEVV